MTSTVEDAWHRLESHLEWVDGPWVGYLFTESIAQARWFEEQARALVAGRHRVLRPATPQDLRELLSRLLADRAAPARLTWVEAAHADPDGLPGAAPGPWTEAWDWLMLRANERRGQLLARVDGGLVFVARPELKARFRQAAPDLWSIRALVLEPPAPPPVAADLEAGPPTLDDLAADLLLRLRFHLDTQPPPWIARVVGPTRARDALRERVAHALPDEVPWLRPGQGPVVGAAVVEDDGDAEALGAPVAFTVHLDHPIGAGRASGAGAHVREAREALELAQRLERRLPTLRGGDADRATARRLEALARAAEALLAQGWVGEASPVVEELLARARAWHGRGRRERRRRVLLATALELQGDVARRAGDLVTAGEALEEALSLREGLTRARGRERQQRLADVARCRALLAELARERGHEERALALLEEVLALRRALVARSQEMETQGELALTLSVLGDLHAERGDLPRARALLQDALEIRERLAAELGALRYVRGCSVSWAQMAEVLLALGDRPGARAARERALQLALQLVAADPGNAAWRMEASIAHGHLGDLLLEQGDADAGAEAWREVLQVREALAEQDPENGRWQQYLAVALGRAAELALRRGRAAEAERLARRAVEISAALADRDPAAVAWQHGVAAAWCRLGDALRARGDHDGAAEAFQRTEAVAAHLAALGDGGARRAARILDGLLRRGLVDEGDLNDLRR